MQPDVRFSRAASISQRNILFFNAREGDIENEATTEDQLFSSRQGIDVESLAKRRVGLLRDVSGR